MGLTNIADRYPVSPARLRNRTQAGVGKDDQNSQQPAGTHRTLIDHTAPSR
jgi:hypothetical protein